MIVFDKLKRGALSPPLEGFVDFGDGRDLSDLATATVKMADENGAAIIDSPLEIIDASTNEVRYQWVNGDTDSVGNNWLEMWFTFNSGDFFKIPPGDEYINILIPSDLPLTPE